MTEPPSSDSTEPTADNRPADHAPEVGEPAASEPAGSEPAGSESAGSESAGSESAGSEPAAAHGRSEPTDAPARGDSTATDETRRSQARFDDAPVMTNDVGSISGDLEITTRRTPGETLVTATYVGSTDTYVVAGSPLPPGTSHETVMAELQRDRGADEFGNATPRDVTALPGASAAAPAGDEGTLG